MSNPKNVMNLVWVWRVTKRDWQARLAGEWCVTERDWRWTGMGLVWDGYGTGVRLPLPPCTPCALGLYCITYQLLDQESPTTLAKGPLNSLNRAWTSLFYEGNYVNKGSICYHLANKQDIKHNSPPGTTLHALTGMLTTKIVILFWLKTFYYWNIFLNIWSLCVR